MNPIVYGIINAFVPGLSYLMLRKREMFGLLLVVGSVAAFVYGFVEPAMWEAAPMFGSNLFSKSLSFISFICFPLAFAVDAYNLAKESGK